MSDILDKLIYYKKSGDSDHSALKMEFLSIRLFSTFLQMSGSGRRDPKFSQFFEGYTPLFDKEVIDQITNDAKQSREPDWELSDWSRYHYLDSFPQLREAIVAWVAHVEAGTLTSQGVQEQRNDGHPELKLSPGPNGVTRDPMGAALPELTQTHLDILFDGSSKISAIALKRAASKGTDRVNEKTTSLDRFKAIPRFHYKDMTLEYFKEHLERPLVPCLISGMTEDWAMQKWTATSLSEGKYKDW